uniref:ATP dependent DNA helicase, putative n=1 Tax=Babesia bovis TaxID=5865 RepID=S6B8Q3_BABBO|nr:ATP dependent DNA helicase, putative [Babesia bovis]
MELTSEEAQQRVSLMGAHVKALSKFFQTFSIPTENSDSDSIPLVWGDHRYMNQLQEIKNRKSNILRVYLDDIRQHFLKDTNEHQVYEGLMLNAYRYLELMYAAADACLEGIERNVEEHDPYRLSPGRHNQNPDVLDSVDELRERRMKQSKLPVYLYSNFEIWLIPGSSDPVMKMDDYDRSAIYEVMEQQTVSIAKAGHCTTMPARSAVLAAANPINGVYDVRKTVFHNMNLPAALLTRFDLQFLMLDRVDRGKDAQLAEHVVNLVKGVSQELTPKYAVVDKELMRTYIKMAQEFEPTMSQSIVEKVSEWYVNVRHQELDNETYNDERFTYTTPRSMLAILRLCQAMARLRFSNTVEMSDFEEAVRLSEQMKISLTEARNDRLSHKRQSGTAQVMHLLRRRRDELKQQADWDGWMPIRELEQQVLSTGLKHKDLKDAIEKYSRMAVVLVGKGDTHIAFPEDLEQ